MIAVNYVSMFGNYELSKKKKNPLLNYNKHMAAQ